ncbi:MAG TPA: alpha/beta hydrolase [Acidimicrobiia bacterium]|nr:alpha/beta hydrolase [Acidimicrobiia bacterium]
MHGVIESSDATLHYETAGSGQPVLFLHAGVADSRMWDTQFTARAGWQLIRFDMRGYGTSRLGSERFTNRDDALAVLDHLGIDSAVIVGCSIGGNTALQIAETAPERIEGLVLVGADAPGYDPGIDYESPEWPAAIEAFESGNLRRVAELEAEMWLAGVGRSTSDLDRRLVELFIDMDLTALGTEADRQQLDVGQPLEHLPEVEGPVLVVVGERDIPQIIASAEHLAAGFDANPVFIPNTAHLPPMDASRRFSETLGRFLTT